MTARGVRTRKGGERIVCLTAHSAPIAARLDPYVDILLVGDSLANTVYGFDSTLPLTLDTMIAHTAAVVRATSRALVVFDMPFGSYQESPEAAFRAAARALAETGCGAVKLEGGETMAATIDFLVKRGVPVMGHIGLTPQAVNALGGYRSQGHDAESAQRLLADARAVAEAGAFSLVIEATSEPVARRICEESPIPTIGIGASSVCDGQVLVTEDMLGLTPSPARFVKRFAQLGEAIEAAAAEFAAEVRDGRFPAAEHTYSPTPAAKS
jgi:3-methyl-2-oxobutanoate hydroxymethyltransferase